jgi:hypothetical protein
MYRRQLVTHIVSELREDTSEEEIKETLRNDGWAEKDIKEAFLYAMYPEKLEHFSLIRALDSEVPVYGAALALFLAVSTFTFVFLEFRNEIRNYNVVLPATPATEKPIFKYGEEPALTNPAFFEKVKNQFIAAGADFLTVDLSAMRVTAYKGGQAVIEAPVLTKGRPGSWWETPAGLYKINSKDKEHFSSMGNVYMPWSMQFQGNFYIHGWPYYPDGQPVASTYSGGCIRLSNETAKAIFDFAEIGAPILVYERDFSSDNFQYTEQKPAVSAKHYLAADLLNNFVFMKSGEGDEEPAPIASLAKLVTALVATEYINLDKTAVVPKSAIVYTSLPRLKPGTEISVYQLLFPLLLESSNEAAEAIAGVLGREKFVSLMNDKAVSIGMTKSVFADPSGASAGNVSTVDDLFMLAKYIYNNRSFVFNISSGRLQNSAYGKSYWSNLENLNDFADDSSFFGGKVGKTAAAEETGLYVFKLPIGGGERPVVIIVLGSNNRKSDAEAILGFIKSSYQLGN